MPRFPLAIISAIAIPLSLLSVAHAADAEWQIVEDDTTVWQGVIDSNVREQDMQAADKAFQENTKELFPDFASSSQGSTSVLDQKRDERTDEFVSTMVNGALVVFTDVPRTVWFAPYVRTIAENGLISGYRDLQGNPTGKFGPADNVTIEQMTKVLVTALGMGPEDCKKPTLNLTASGSWSAPYMACAELRQLPVIGDGSVDVHRNATRLEVVATILSAYKVMPETGTGASFLDVTATSQFAGFIAKAKSDGIISGYADANGVSTGLFGPNDPITRAEFAKIMTLALQGYGINK